jgi:hypothetical protein
VDTKLPEQPPLPQIYANLSQVTASVSDISITLGLSGTALMGASENGPMTSLAVLRLSPSAAKMLLLNLEQMLTVYEARFSKIYVPKEFEAALSQSAVALGIAQKNGSL